jgi:hypothetical protein
LNGRSQSALLTMRAGYAADVLVHLIGREEHALLRLAARVADQPGAAADQGNRRVAGPLQPRERHDRQKRPDVQTRGRGIEADVSGHRTGGEGLAQALGAVIDHLAPRQFFVQIDPRHASR